MQTSNTTQLQARGITLLRVVTGIVFLIPGVQHLFLQDISHLQNNFQNVSQLPGPIVIVGALVELLCGAALVVGLLTRWVCMPLALLVLMDILVFHPPSGFFEEDNGFEHALLRLAASAALALAGPGKVALDNMPAIRRGPK